ncbi:hypothetical protein HID58_004892 [Brassica napus]|uniref:Peptidylprolyl isomerase n=1 Tax=Brassica napus TaxID=3708 RepID=A0ABQ8E9Y6_BRANA|nr:hypothetical protein HID58_004892 [Brassica napus]
MLYHVQKFIARSRQLTSQVELEMRYPGVKHFAWCKVASSVPLLIWSLLLLRTLSSIQINRILIYFQGRKKGKALHYKGSSFHRIIPSLMLQGCDFTHGNMEWEENLFMVRPLLMRTLNASILVQGFCQRQTPAKTPTVHKSAASMFPHNINTQRAWDFIQVGRHVVSGNGCGVQKMEADGNQSGTPKSKVVSFLCNSTRGAFSIDHATFKSLSVSKKLNSLLHPSSLISNVPLFSSQYLTPSLSSRCNDGLVHNKMKGESVSALLL